MSREFFRTWSAGAAALVVAMLISACSAAASDADWLRSEYGKAKAGAVIEIPAGVYDLKDWKLDKSITLRGAPEGGVVFQSAAVTDKGVLIPLKGVSLTVENVTFRDVTAWDKNGAGVRHEGRDLTLVNCVFERNEDGVLATGEPEGVIRIVGSRFSGNGFGDGQSHGIYVFAAARLEIEDSEFVGTRIGHHVKSLADETTITGTHFDDAHGRTSYTLDASKGGRVVLRDNTIIQAATSDNQAIVNYDLTRGGDAVDVVIENNRIVNHHDGGVLIRNDTKIRPLIVGNEIVDEAKRPLRITYRGSPAPIRTRQ